METDIDRAFFLTRRNQPRPENSSPRAPGTRCPCSQVSMGHRVGPPQLARYTSLDNKIQPEKWTKDENRHFTQEDTRW